MCSGKKQEVRNVTESRFDASAPEATQGQMDVFFGKLSHKCHLEEVASVGDLT